MKNFLTLLALLGLYSCSSVQKEQNNDEENIIYVAGPFVCKKRNGEYLEDCINQMDGFRVHRIYNPLNVLGIDISQ